MATQYVKDEEAAGNFIAASQRADGSWRKPRRVKEGFVPQEEVPLYESKGKKLSKERNTGLPPGLTPEAWERMKQQQQQLAGGGGGKGSGKSAKPKLPNPNVLATGITVEENINGSNQSTHNNSWTTVGGKKKSKTTKNGQQLNNNNDSEELSGKVKSLSVSSGSTKTNTPLSTNNSGQPINTDPAKRLKNLRKKVIEIEKLQMKDHSTLDKDQLEKIGRLQEILDSIEALEAEI